MGFSVDTDALRKAATELELLGGHSTRYKNYADSYVSLDRWPDVGWIYSDFWNTAKAVNEKLAEHTQDIASTHTVVGDTLRASASDYDTGEQANLAAIDALTPGQSTPIQCPANPPQLRAEDPTAVLSTTPPGASEAAFSLLQEVSNLGDWTSVSGAIMHVMSLVGIPNPAEWVIKYATGDYNAVITASQGLEALGEVEANFSAAVLVGQDHLHSSWTGNAAGRCMEYLDQLSDAYDSAGKRLQRLANEYYSMALAMKSACDFCLTGLALVLDHLLIMLIEWAATAAANVIPVAGQIASLGTAAASAVEAWKIYSEFQRIKKAVDRASKAADVFTAYVLGFTARAGIEYFSGIPTLPRPSES